MEHVWAAFCAVAATRPNNGFGLLPISYAEIAAWDALTGALLTPWEVSLVRRIDTAVLPILNAKKGAEDAEVEVDANDEVGVKSVFANLKSRARGVFGKKPVNDPAQTKA